MNIKSYAVNIREKKNDIVNDIKDGLKYAFSNKVLSNAVIMMLGVGIIATNGDIITPVFAKEVLRQQAKGYGFLMAAMGIGSLIGSLIFASKKGGFDHSILFKSAVALCVFLVITGFMRNYYLSLASVAAIGLFKMIFMAAVNSTIQLNTSDEYRGRMMGVYTLVFTGTTPIGNFLSGVITQNYGPSVTFIISGASTAVLIMLIYFLKGRREKDLVDFKRENPDKDAGLENI